MPYQIDNIEISKKTTVGKYYCKRCRLLIYQDSPDISGSLIYLDAFSRHLNEGVNYAIWVTGANNKNLYNTAHCPKPSSIQLKRLYNA